MYILIMVGEIFHHLTISTPHPFQYNGSSMLNGELKSFSISCFVSFSLSIALSVGMRQSMPNESSRMDIPPSASG